MDVEADYLANCYIPEASKEPRKQVRAQKGPQFVRANEAALWQAQMDVRQDEVNGAVEDHGTTTMHDDAIVTSNVARDINALDTAIVNTGSTGYVQDIKEFLKKPILIDSAVYNTVAQGVINTYDIPKLPFGNKLWQDKLSGFLGIRGTFHITLQVNANPMQQGRLMMVYEPQAQDVNNRWARYGNLTSMTQMPRVELDIGTETSVTLTIPYITLTTHYNLLNGEGSWGIVSLINYLDFQSIGGTKCDYTIWCHMTDVELVAPTLPITEGDIYMAQMSQVSRTRGNKKSLGASDQEAERGAKLSTALLRVSQASSVLAGIPLLSSIAGPTAWATALAGKVAGALGYCSPPDLSKTERVNITSNRFQQNCNATENANNMGLFMDNHVGVLPSLGGTDLDEASFDYIKGVYSYIDTVVWSASTTEGTAIWTFNLCPSSFFNQDTSRNPAAFYPTAVAGLSNLFQFYRGGLVFKFKFAKTRFHSGRLLLCYTPGYKSAPGGGNAAPYETATISDSNYLHREVIDIREGVEFEYRIPFVSLIPWLQWDQAFGKIELYVLNPLVAPDSVVANVDFAVEVKGDTDLQFAGPKTPQWQPYGPVPPSAARAAVVEAASVGDVYVSQMENSHDLSETAQTVNKPIGNSTVDKVTTLPAEYCIGELVTHCKQLGKRTVFATNGAITAPQNWRPFELNSGSGGNYAYLDYISYFGSAFAFNRGGMIYRLQLNATNTNTVRLWTHFDSSTNVTTASNRYLSTIFEASINGQQLVGYLPQYTPTFGRLSGYSDVTNLGGKWPFRSATVAHVETVNSAVVDNASVGRSIADDYQWGFFLGFPVMTAYSNPSWSP